MEYPADTGSYAPKSAEIERQPTLEGLVALTDQVEAAVSDVGEAWAQFKYGPRPEAAGIQATDTDIPDRIQRADNTLRQQVALLQGLARDIRSRT